MNNANYRYPGASPFEPEQRKLFFGRERDIEALSRLIKLRQIVVLFGKSGTGKSSLLNAGIIPCTESEGKFTPVRVRFKARAEAGETDFATPLFSTKKIIRGQNTPERTFLDGIIPEEESLWHHVKEHTIRNNGEQGLFLIFDQFEEMFTYGEADVLAFKQELAEALFTDVPQRYWEALENLEAAGEKTLTPEQLEIFQLSPQVKILVCCRYDRVHLLSRLDDYLPNILKNNYELKALDTASARKAIVEPARAEGEFYSKPFEFNDGADQHILDFLTENETEKIETTQLQIVCRYIEKKAREHDLRIILRKDIGDLDSVIEGFYDDSIKALPLDEQLPAKQLIEDFLVFEEEERRLSLLQGQVLKKIKPETLRALLESHLLRIEPALQGGYTYELSHDTLVAPVLKAKAIRKAAEQEEEETQRAIEFEKEMRKRKRFQRLSIGLFAMGVFSVAAMLFAFSESEKSQKGDIELVKQKAEREKSELEAQIKIQTTIEEANRKIDTLNHLTREAEIKLNKVKKEEQLAREETIKERVEKSRIESDLQQLRNNMGATQEQLHKAKQDSVVAEGRLQAAEEKNRKILMQIEELQKKGQELGTLLLEEASSFVYKLDYDRALENMYKAAWFESMPKSRIRDSLLEIAFVFVETEDIRVHEVFETIAKWSGDRFLGDTLKFAELQNYIKSRYPSQYRFLRARYYPTMISITGGKTTIGPDAPNLRDVAPKVTVSNFKMAKTETTWWQYYLFAKATGRENGNAKVSGEWKLGDYPVAEVSWQDAIAYANWLNKKEGFEAAITMSNEGECFVDLRSTGYRLPTEAEWEYAARDKEGDLYSGNAGISNEVAWFSGNSGQRPHPVAQKDANRRGLYDMSGNLFEWCWDWWGKNSSDGHPADYDGPKSGSKRVIKGGCFRDTSFPLKQRESAFPEHNKSIDIGFRVVQGQL